MILLHRFCIHHPNPCRPGIILCALKAVLRHCNNNNFIFCFSACIKKYGSPYSRNPDFLTCVHSKHFLFYIVVKCSLLLLEDVGLAQPSLFLVVFQYWSSYSLGLRLHPTKQNLFHFMA